MATKFNYNQTVAQAKLLDELANDIQNQCCKKMGEICENIEAAWTRQTASTYKNYICGVRDDMLKKAKYIRDTAGFLRTAADKMKAADDAAKQASDRVRN